uniref:Endonuclease/exonuclease/phosphatase n=1 Tax=Sphingobacterium sp. (strain 21) TaxID=743722 RepID=F4CBG6_SPHS2
MMQARNVIMIFIALLLLIVQVERISAQQKLKIMSYNIHHGADANEQDQLEAMAAFIKESGADIVGLQEVDSMCRRSGNVDQPRVLAQKTGMHYTYTRHFAYDGGSYGQALLSRFPIERTVNERLPVSTGATTSFLTAEVVVPTHRTLSIGVVHLDYRAEAGRLRQAEIIDSIIKKASHPFILTGDMNAEPQHETLAVLSKQLIATQGRDAFTYPTAPPKKKIDYIMLDKRLKASVIEAKVLPVLFSDHLPIVSTIEIAQ